MRDRLLMILIMALAVFMKAPAVVADVPTLIGYQGILTDSEGDPVTEPVNITFTIYLSPSGDPNAWQETQLVEFDDDGRFDVSLGETTPISDDVFSDPVRWLGVQVEGDAELVPRTRIVSVAYANRISTVDGATGGIISGDVTIQSDLTVDGAIDATGIESKIRFFYNTLGDLPDPIAYHGMFAHVHLEGRAFYAHAGEWVPLANEAEAGGGWIDDGTVVRLETSTDSVGIGTATPAEKLDVAGNILVTGKATIGPSNTNTGTSAFVAGQGNSATAIYTSVSGGVSNIASGDNSTISGGNGNTASGFASAVSGGANNTASGNRSAVGGGYENTAANDGSTVAGGTFNDASVWKSTVGGGAYNKARGNYSVVSGGGGDVEADSNSAIGNHSMVPGGTRNIAGGTYSFAAGRRAQANHNGAFVWADQTDADFVSTGADQFLIRASGGVGIGTTTPSHTLEVGDGFGTRYIAVNGQTGGMSGYKLMAGGTQKWFIGLPGISQLYFRNEANNEVMVLRQDGNVGIGTASPQGALDVSSTTGAFILPRMTTAQRNALTAVNGMIIYNTTNNQFNFYENSAWVTK